MAHNTTIPGAGHPLLFLTLARFREFIREPSALFWTFAFPLLLTVALGLAFRNQRPFPQPVGLVGDTDGRLGRALRTDTLTVRVLPEALALDELRRSELVLVVKVTSWAGACGGRAGCASGPKPDGGFGGVGAADTPGVSAVDYIYDPQRSDSVLARAQVDAQLQRGLGRADVVSTTDVKVEAPGSRYIDWMVPGLLGTQLGSSSLWGIAFVLVQQRQKKLLKRLAATPMRRADYLGAFVLWRLLFVLFEVGILLAFAHLAFHVPLKGSLWSLFTVSLLGAASFAGIGLLCASRAKNAETANGLINMVQLPMYLVSGVFFSASRFPSWAQLPIHLLPLTALNDALRAIINEGQGLAAVGGPVLILGAWGALSGLLALAIFRWTA